MDASSLRCVFRDPIEVAVGKEGLIINCIISRQEMTLWFSNQGGYPLLFIGGGLVCFLLSLLFLLWGCVITCASQLLVYFSFLVHQLSDFLIAHPRFPGGYHKTARSRVYVTCRSISPKRADLFSGLHIPVPGGADPMSSVWINGWRYLGAIVCTHRQSIRKSLQEVGVGYRGRTGISSWRNREEFGSS